MSWVAVGASLAVLAAAIGKPILGLLALCIGGMDRAITAGILFVPAPAGAGMREVVLGIVLATALSTSGQVVAVVIASRVVIRLADLSMAGLASLAAHLRSRATA